MRQVPLLLCLSICLGACEGAPSGPGVTAGTDAVAADQATAADVPDDTAVSAGTDATAPADVPPADQPSQPPDDVPTATPDTAEEGDILLPKGVESVTKSGAYTVLLDGPMDLKVAQKGSYTAWVTDATGGPAVGLKPLVSFIHTAMGHGGLKNPNITEIGGGAYAVANVVPSMSGTWRLSIQLVKGEIAKWDIKVVK